MQAPLRGAKFLAVAAQVLEVKDNEMPPVFSQIPGKVMTGAHRSSAEARDVILYVPRQAGEVARIPSVELAPRA
jgi:hypothetical protein